MKNSVLIFALASLVLVHEAVESAPAPADGLYVVQPGDTLSGIAVRFHTTVRELARANGIADPNRLRVGQRLRLIPEDAIPAAPAAPAPESSVSADTLPPPPPPAPPVAQLPSPPSPPVARRVHSPTPSTNLERTPHQARFASFQEDETFYSSWIQDRLAVGLSLSYFRLTDADRPRDKNRQKTFLGYINHLDEENQIAWAPTLTWTISDYVRLGITYHSIEARTLNFPLSPYNEQLSDGNVKSFGPLLLAEGTYPLAEGRWRPHMGVGIGMYRGDFSEDTWWELGYPTPQDWHALGSPTKTALGKRRYIEVDDAVGVSLILGIAWRPIREFELDLSLRRTFLEPDCEFGYKHDASGRKEPEQSGEFTLDSISVVVTASYVF